MTADALEEPLAAPRRRWRAVLRDTKAVVGLVVLAVLVISALLAPWIAPYDPNEMGLDMLAAPSAAHPLGQDDLGRDLLSRLIWGGQVSLFVGVTTVALAFVIGGTLGVLAGYYGGWVDTVIMRYIDLQWAFPNIIIAVWLVAVVGPGLSNVMVAITLAFLDDFARVARGMTLQIKSAQYIDAARSIGASGPRIMWRHIAPNAMAPLIVLATVSVSNAILIEAVLSFLGLGVSADTPTWGLILSEARSFVSRAWWLGVFPGVFIMVTILSINFLGDALRDALDVRETGNG